MQSKRITKYLVAMLGIFALGLLTLTGLSFLPRNNQSASANTQYMTIQKVFVPDITASDTETDTTKPWHIEESAQTISEGDFVMLDTSKHSYQDSNGTMYTGREAVAISFVGPSMSSSVSKSIILNGQEALETNKVNEYETSSDGTTTGSEYSTFFQYLFALTPTEVSADNLNDCYYTTYSIKNGEIKRVNSPEGKYAVSLTYYDPNAVGTQTEGITFYVTTQKTYNQPNENPTLNDTEKLELEDVDTSNKTKKYMTATKQYFNFNNMSTTYYNATQREFITRDKTNPTQLYYPTLIYNPEKFDISYTRTLYNYRETVTATFGVQKVVNTAGETVEIGYLDVLTTTNKDTTLTIKRTYVVEADEDGKYSIKMQFDNVGEYVITKTPKLRIGYTDESVKINYATPAQDSAVVTANEEYLQDVTLVINGYTALYSKTATTSAPLYDDTYSYGAMENSNTLNRVNDTIYAHDFLVSSDSETIGINARDRAETIYTADMTFINNSFVNSSPLTMTSGLKKNILASDSNITDSVAFSKFFDYIKTTNYIKQSLEYTQNGVNYYVERASTNLAPVKF